MSSRTRRLVAALAATRDVAVLSGRGLADLAAKMDGIPVRWLVGGHGAEWPGVPTSRALVRRVAAWRRELASRLAAVDGVDIEDKEVSLSIHWRAARSPARVAAAVEAAAAGLPGAALIGGKRVLNVVPLGAPDKGAALARIVAESRCERVVFVGDDVTDEAAFRERLPVPAVMVRVGRARGSAAGYFVRRRADVDRLLARLVPPSARPGRAHRRGARRLQGDAPLPRSGAAHSSLLRGSRTRLPGNAPLPRSGGGEAG
jgi:trehalose 6-phosphate phosphatase